MAGWLADLWLLLLVKLDYILIYRASQRTKKERLAEAWTDRSHSNDDEWEINAHTSKTI